MKDTIYFQTQTVLCQLSILEKRNLRSLNDLGSMGIIQIHMQASPLFLNQITVKGQ